MASLISYGCEGCGYSFKAGLGFGFCYPSQFQGAVKAVREGQYGKEYRRKALFNAEVMGRVVAIDLTRAIARCEDCGEYQTIVDNTLYALPRRQDPGPRIWTGSQEEFFVMPNEMKAHGKVIGVVDHRCEACNGKLHALEGEPAELTCPKCGSMMPKQLEALVD